MSRDTTFSTLSSAPEGTLGVITKAELKVRRTSRARKTKMTAVDADVAVGWRERLSCLGEWRYSEQNPAPRQLGDQQNRRDVAHGFAEGCRRGTPFRGPDGDPDAVEKEMEKIVEITKHHGATDVRVAKDQAEADTYWMARKAGFAATYGKMPTVLSEAIYGSPREHTGPHQESENRLERSTTLKTASLATPETAATHLSVLTVW